MVKPNSFPIPMRMVIVSFCSFLLVAAAAFLLLSSESSFIANHEAVADEKLELAAGVADTLLDRPGAEPPQASPVSAAAEHHALNAKPLGVLQNFDGWLEAFQEFSAAVHPETFLARGVGIARERRPVMAALIQRDPEEALRRAVPADLYSRLPEEIVEHLEEPFDATGDFFVTISCADIQGHSQHDGRSEISRTVELSHDSFQATAPEGMGADRSHRGARVRGIALDQWMALAEVIPASALYSSSGDAGDGSDVTAGVSAAADPSWTTGTKRLLYIRLDFPDLPWDGPGEEGIEEEMARVSEFLDENSRGEFALEVTVRL